MPGWMPQTFCASYGFDGILAQVCLYHGQIAQHQFQRAIGFGGEMIVDRRRADAHAFRLIGIAVRSKPRARAAASAASAASRKVALVSPFTNVP
jgi:hypothetical protein